jgi:quinohemoprotein ethanol dehydrogenase
MNRTVALLAAMLALAFQAALVQASGSGVIDNNALGDEEDGADWPAYGRTFSESHFSPLRQINEGTIARLGLAWTLNLDVSNSVTAPLEVDGVIYLAAGYSIVHAIDAKTGRLLWRHDPKVSAASGAKLRIGWGIRGLAFWKGRVYVGTHDGRLIALDAYSGHQVWGVQTLLPGYVAYISGPPRVFNGKVVIGNAGADFSPLRGYVTAYDARDGSQLWRFFVVPGKPGTKDGAASDDVMGIAARTWTGEFWKHGGGGNVWNAMTYDPEFNRLYIGTGNGSPMNWKIRSPDGGDNLFVASVVALNADTGHYIWHYQTTPGDSWDYDSATDMSLAEIVIDGRPRKVLLHAAKNGFFYVIDREDGRLVSAGKMGDVTWADRIDMETGRPLEVPGARYADKSVLISPSFQGLHHWSPQSYSPLTGLVYEPTLDMPSMFGDAGVRTSPWTPQPETPEFGGLTVGTADIPRDAGKSVLLAWDPTSQKAVWRVETRGISNGGTLATAGNLVFQGLADGYLHAYSADKGKDLWSFFAGVAVTGVPITYSVDGRQYVTITSGPLNGVTGAFGSVSAQWGWDSRIHPKRLLTFTLDGNAVIPPTAPPRTIVPVVAEGTQVDSVKATAGAHLYARCLLCHGTGVVAGGIAPDLRASPVVLAPKSFAAVVRDGALVSRGMPGFPEFTAAQLDSLRQYVRLMARGTEVESSTAANPR